MIKVLDKFIADKIAAGEVIERPVSAVKELVENSIDAGARSIIVEIRGGGKSYIRVTDDGCGIPQEEAETAFLRHATSKISGIADLDNISSLGFRGEALASISAVSRLTMVTRTPDASAGVRLIMHGGKVISRETFGANIGTTIVCEDIFYNTPARRKFMGSDAREGSAVIDLIQQYAVCYSGIRFMMIRNGETVFTTPGNGDTLSAIKHLYPDTDHADLLCVEKGRVTGYVSDPGTTRSTRKGQLFFVNGRLVSSKVIEKGIEKGYGGRIFSGFPICILFIGAEPSEIDVNIHPGKREIRFLHEDIVISDVAAAIDEAMQTREAVPSGLAPSQPSLQEIKPVTAQSSIPVIPESPRPDSYHVPASADTRSSGSETETFEVTSEKTVVESNEEIYEADSVSEQLAISEYLSSLRREPAGSRIDQTESVPRSDNAGMKFDFSSLEYRGCLFDTYIVMQSADTVYLFDQHAAHERIFYEKLTSHYSDGEKFTQPVLTPVTINVSADVYYMGRDLLDTLRRFGYDIEDFGTQTFMIRGIPSYMEMSEAVSFAEAFLQDSDDAPGNNKVVIDKLIMKSCKSAVKANEKLSRMETDRLIADLAKCANPYACPHGRPTFIRYTKYEIERSFRRK